MATTAIPVPLKVEFPSISNPVERSLSAGMADAVTPADLEHLRQVSQKVGKMWDIFGRAVEGLNSSFAALCDGIVGWSASRHIAEPLTSLSGSGIYALGGIFHLPRTFELIQSIGSSIGRVLIDPTMEALSTAAKLSGEGVLAATRVGYLLSMANIIRLNPLFHQLNLAAMGVCSTTDLMTEVSAYVRALSKKRDAEGTNNTAVAQAALQDQIAAMIGVAKNVALLAFVYITYTAASFSMLPITAASGTAFAAAALLSLIGTVHNSVYRTASVNPVRFSKAA